MQTGYFPKQAAVGETAAANAIPALLETKPSENEFEGIKATAKKKKQMEGQRTFGQNLLDRIMGLEFGRSKRGATICWVPVFRIVPFEGES